MMRRNPFRSRAQQRLCYATQDPDWDCSEWSRETDFSDLPEYVGNPRKTQDEVYREWKSLVNMSIRELEEFMDSPYGKAAGLSEKEAARQGIGRGWDSAKAILRMKRKGVEKWGPDDWGWAYRQISFIKRMRGVRGPLEKPNGEPTRKLLALLIWGHNPL